MKPTPLLESWQKPANAGEPLAVLATTFALDPDFFERNCLARFLEVSSVNEETGSIDDIVAGVELQELLQKATVTVLADRSAPVLRSSLLWDLLGCRVETGLLHSKVAVLIWENATRVILGSANLTAAGYRRQIELGLAADLGPGCLFPPDVLTMLADELASYLPLVPGYDPAAAVFLRATTTLTLFRQRIARSPLERSAIRVAFAPTNATTSPLDSLATAWSGAQPLQATHLSPFWDGADRKALATVRKLLTGRPTSERKQSVAVVLDPRGRTAFPKFLAGEVDSICELKPLDGEARTLHAKCLLLESAGWVAALVGSSNHTNAGLGLTAKRHREVNVWLGAPRTSKEGKALLRLIQLGNKVAPDAPELATADEDEIELPSLPSCFGLCRVAQGPSPGSWALHLGIESSADMPPSWDIRIAAGDHSVFSRLLWEQRRSAETVIVLTQDSLPMYVLVEWNGQQLPWATVVDERYALPPLPALAKLDARQLLEALAAGRSLAQALRDALEEEAERAARKKRSLGLDPLRRLEVKGSLLRKGRALAASISAMQRRLEQPVAAIEVLQARLASPLGPEFVAIKVVEDAEARPQNRAEAVFTIAEIALAVGRVDWTHVLERVDRRKGLMVVTQTLARLEALRARLGESPADLVSYATRAIEESRACLPF